jgi:hypothetical protein
VVPDITPGFSGIRCCSIFSFCVVFCRSLFVPLFCLFWSLHCHSFYLWHMLTPWVSWKLLTFYDRELEAVNIDIKIKKKKIISTIYKKIYYFVRWYIQTIYFTGCSFTVIFCTMHTIWSFLTYSLSYQLPNNAHYALNNNQSLILNNLV